MIHIKDVKKIYNADQKPITALQNIDLDVAEKTLISVVGPSGCGKSTLLRLIAGLEIPTSGALLLHDKKIVGPGVERGFVFQQYGLMPWLTVEKNMSFGLKKKTLDTERVNEYLQISGLSEYSHLYPKQLSGGMQQRVAIARSLIMQPKILLLDEPFGAIDYYNRMRLQQYVLDMYQSNDSAIILVTHDIEEAVFLSDHIYVLSQSPGTIIKEYTIPFSRPRKQEIKHTQEFIALKKSILSDFVL